MTSRWICLAAAVLSGLISVSAQAATVRVTIDKLIFVPAEVTAKVGDTVEWINKDILAHTATATNGDWNVAIAPILHRDKRRFSLQDHWRTRSSSAFQIGRTF